MTLSLIQDFPLPHTPPVTSFPLEAYKVIQKERQRQMRIEQRTARGTAGRESSAQPQVPESSTDSTSLDSLILLGSEGVTPQQRFCLVDLVDDSDAIYGRMQWANKCESPELSAYQRQRHADELALRFFQYTACSQSRPLMPSRSVDQGQQPLKLPELHHPYGILSEDSATEQRGRPHGGVWESDEGSDGRPDGTEQKESA